MPEEADEERNQERLRKAYSKRLREMQLEEQKLQIARKYLLPEAYARLSNVRMSNRELYNQFINLLVAMIQSNRLQGQMSDEQLRSILERLTAKPEGKIEFRHK